MNIKPMRPMNSPPIWLQDGYDCMEAHLAGKTWIPYKLSGCIAWMRSIAQRCDQWTSRAPLSDPYYNAETKEWVQAEFTRLCLVLELKEEKPIK